MSEATEIVEYYYSSSLQSWVELPIDYSANDFFKKLNNSGRLAKRISAQQGQSIIQSLRDRQGQSAIYNHIYHNAIRELKSSSISTKPISIFWETAPLIEALITAHCESPKERDEKLSQNTFATLAQMMSQKSHEEIDEDYSSQIILSHPDVQRAMVMQFDSAIKRRLVAIWDLIHSVETDNLGQSTITVLKELDKLLISLIDENNTHEKPNGVAFDNSVSFTTKLNNLYFDLIRPRDSMRCQKQRLSYESELRFSLPKSKANAELIDCIKRILSQYIRNNQHRLSVPFQPAYIKYLLASNPHSRAEQSAKSFFADYLELNRYINQTSSVDSFTNQVQKDLYRFAKELFYSLEKTDLGHIDGFENVFTHASDAFAYSRLNSAHAKIWHAVHTPLWLLSMEKVVTNLCMDDAWCSNNPFDEFFRAYRNQLLFDLLDKRLQELTCRIKQERSVLHGKFPQIKLLRNFEPETIADFVNAFNYKCPEVYKVNAISSEYINELICAGVASSTSATCNQLMILELEAVILKMECQIIVLSLADEAVNALKQEHNILRELF